MKNKLVILFAALFAFAVAACKKLAPVKQKDPPIVAVTSSVPPTFGWVAQIGGDSNNAGTDINIDNSANVYSYGGFRNTIDFDPGPAVFNLTATPDVITPYGTISLSSNYMQELDSAGKFITARLQPAGYATVTRGADGVIFRWLTTDSIFKYDAAGVLLSTITPKRAPAYEEHYSGVTTDVSGNLYIAGYIYLNRTYDKYGQVVDFGTFSAYLKKLDINGNVLWTRSDLTNSISNIGIDGLGNIYGYIKYSDIIKKFDPTGSLQLTTKIQMGQTADNLHFVSTMAVDKAGNCYFTGIFTGTLDFDMGPKVFSLTSRDHNMFLQKIDASGNFVWAVQFINVGQYDYYSEASFSSLTLDNENNIYLTGQFYGTVNFDPRAGTHTLTKAYAEYFDEPSTDAFVLKLNQGH